MTASANLDLVRSIFAGWERGDYFSRTDWAHPDIEYVEVTEGPEPGTWTGLDEMAKTVGDRLSMWEDFAPRAEEFRQLDDERVLVLQSYRGRAKGSGVKLDDIAPKGAHLFEIRDGKVTRLGVNTKRNKEARCRRSDYWCGAASEMEGLVLWTGGPPRPPCRGRPQTTARCAGQEPGC